VIFERVQRGLRQRERLDVHLAGLVELKARDASVRGDVVILLADRAAESIDLELAREPRAIARQELHSALSSAVVKLPDEPSPVPAGMSASVVISCWSCVMPLIRNASRTIGCWMSSTRDTVSICEYLRNTPCMNGRWIVAHTYLSIAAAIKKPPWDS
jgi:hypothetical protein